MNGIDLSQFPPPACIQRHPANPVLKAEDVPYPATLIFNAGVTRFAGKYVMVFRNDVGEWGSPRFRETNLGLAWSDDGVSWRVSSRPCFTRDDLFRAAAHLVDNPERELRRAYDPRLTVIDGRCYMCFAVDSAHGVRGGVAVTEDFEKFDILSIDLPDNRNMVLFPQKIDGQFVRLERPMPVYSRGGRDRFDCWLRTSPDLIHWGNARLVLAVEDVPFANDKIGPGAPPVLTESGWLTTFHAVDIDPQRGKNGWENAWKKRYCAGLMLLDREQPWKVKGMCPTPLLQPQAPYEQEGGFRNDVIFPGGMILEDDGECKIYYGAADTVECLATARVEDLVSLCTRPVIR
ncbi:MAG: glycosidase [Lentisphaerae bacterium]|nr:MAG: glycosidase [Lentisphaerota bacterium]